MFVSNVFVMMSASRNRYYYFPVTNQRRIQDFPGGGGGGGANIQFCQMFPNLTAWNRKNLGAQWGATANPISESTTSDSVATSSGYMETG